MTPEQQEIFDAIFNDEAVRQVGEFAMDSYDRIEDNYRVIPEEWMQYDTLSHWEALSDEEREDMEEAVHAFWEENYKLGIVAHLSGKTVAEVRAWMKGTEWSAVRCASGRSNRPPSSFMTGKEVNL